MDIKTYQEYAQSVCKDGESYYPMVPTETKLFNKKMFDHVSQFDFILHVSMEHNIKFFIIKPKNDER